MSSHMSDYVKFPQILSIFLHLFSWTSKKRGQTVSFKRLSGEEKPIFIYRVFLNKSLSLSFRSQTKGGMKNHPLFHPKRQFIITVNS